MNSKGWVAVVLAVVAAGLLGSLITVILTASGRQPAVAERDWNKPVNPVDVKFVADLYPFIAHSFEVTEWYAADGTRTMYGAFWNLPGMSETYRLQVSVVPWRTKWTLYGNRVNAQRNPIDAQFSFIATLEVDERYFSVKKVRDGSPTVSDEIGKPFDIYVEFTTGWMRDAAQAEALLKIVQRAQLDQQPLALEGYLYSHGSDSGNSRRHALDFKFIITKINGITIKYEAVK